MPPNLRLHLITRIDQMKPGEYYKICGSAADGLPIPAQVFHYQEPRIMFGYTYFAGVLYWQEAFARYCKETVMTPAEVNIPDSGWSDVHLEHIELPAEGLKDPDRYADIQHHRKLYRPSLKRTYDRLLQELKKSGTP